MQLVIQGKNYDLVETLSKPSLNDLYYLKIKTISEEFPKGVSLKSMVPVMQRMADFDDPTDLLDDPELLLNLRSLIFLCRKHAGEQVTLDSANNFPIDEFSFLQEESDNVVVNAAANPPQALTDSDQGDAAHKTPVPTASRTTSKPTSPNGSPSSPASGQG